MKADGRRVRSSTTALTHTTGAARCEGSSIPITFGRSRQRLGARLARWKAPLSGAFSRVRFSVEPTRGPQIQGPFMTSNDHASNELREHLARVIEILRPHAQSSGRFHNPSDLATAIGLAAVSLERAGRLVGKLGK
jgi:hypothetical protein